MRNFSYSSTQRLFYCFILLTFLMLLPITYAQQRTEEERAGKIALEYYQQNILQQSGSTGDNSEAIQERFFTGQAANDQFGFSVASAGDVNGDGFDDIIIGARLYDGNNTNCGRAYIFLGGQIMDNIPDVILKGEQGLNDYFGSSVAGAGDLNGDGYSDVIVGAPGTYYTGDDAGTFYIYFGGNPMSSTFSLFRNGYAAGDNLGTSVGSAGDVNGDGYSDVIVGAYLNDAGGANAGRAYICFGGAMMNLIVDVTLTGAATSDYFGFSVSTAGDVNGDGYSDVIVGAYGNDAGGADAGRAYLYFGGASMDNTADVILTGAAATDWFGFSVSTAGDVNGDGYSDVIVGAYFNDAGGSNAGRAYVYFGGASMNNTANITLTGSAANDYFGNSVSTAGDVNGDGYSDVIVGAGGNDVGGTDAGRAYIYFGSANMENIADVTLTGAAAYDEFGCSVSSAGDVNGDGYSDVIVGAPNNDAGGANAGRAYLYTNSLTGPDIPDEFFTGAAAYDEFGCSVSSAGDVNGDGHSDVIVGAYGNDGGGDNAGRAYIYFGGQGLNNSADVTLTGAATGDYFGISVSTAGDVNGDGYSDVIVGAPLNDAGGTDAGRAYIFFGGQGMNNIADVILTGAAAYDRFGNSVSTAEDVNGDGYSDVIVGAYGNDGGGDNAGRAYIYFGGASMNNVADVIMTGAATNDFFGSSVSTAGDVNGDGYSDVIVGAIGNDAGGTDAGRAYIYFGGSIMNNIVDVTLTGASADDLFGSSVSTAGDVNGDGYSDVIVGAFLNDAGGTDAGRAYIYFGGAIMDNTADVVLTGAAAYDRFGNSVSTAEDVNGDGYSDVIVGAHLNDAGGNNAGRAYLYFGGSSMNNVAHVTMTGADDDEVFGYSVSTAGDANGDGYSDVIVGAHLNDAGGNNAGRAYLFLSSSPPIKPNLFSVTDVPDDQGGKIKLHFARSGYDIKGINKIISYKVLRSYPPGSIGFSWEIVGTIVPIKVPYYTFTDNTPNNSNLFYYRILAQTANPDEYWFSGILSGRSIDNLAPEQVKNFNASIQGINNKLSWKANTEADLKNYHIYRALTPTIDPDTMTAFLVTTDTTGLDTSVPPGDMFYFIRARDIHDNFGPLAQINSPLPLRQINFNALIEGFYNSGSNSMVEDTVTVLLKNTSAPYTTIDQSKVKLSSSGNGLVKFRNAANSTNYYLVVKHRNSIETWSKVGQQFTNSEMVYDFTSSANKAFGDNMKLKGSKWTIYSGDVNQDGAVDIADLALVDNDSYNFVSGYVPTDVNGNGSVEALDMNIVDNNAYNFIISVTPTTLAKPSKEQQLITQEQQD